jgi:protein-S-isoprenylcysteine O-methyltransferase Ste14
VKARTKLAIVAAGYLVAFVVASVVVAVRLSATSGPAAQASSGMYAFGDAVLFVGVFGVVGLAPTEWGSSSSGRTAGSGTSSPRSVSRSRSRASARSSCSP